jgi:hypothetical protein
VLPGYFIPNVVDHEWAEIDPSKDDKTWIHVEPTDACALIQKGQDINGTVNNVLYYKTSHYRMVLAFRITEDRHIIIVDRTNVYSPNQ